MKSSDELISAMQRKRIKIDCEYPDTLLQIWHYYVLYQNCPDSEKSEIIDSLMGKVYNPLIIASMINFGDKANKKIFQYIRDTYISESHSKQWRTEIMYSKWWLPLFKLSRYDSYNYDKFMHSVNFPAILREFAPHTVETLDVANATEYIYDEDLDLSDIF